jgi:hypothetical protein
MPTIPGPNRGLRCDRCGCVLEVTSDELLQFSQGEWPRCCMRPMIIDVDDQSVRPSDATDLERPARPVRSLSHE